MELRIVEIVLSAQQRKTQPNTLKGLRNELAAEVSQPAPLGPQQVGRLRVSLPGEAAVMSTPFASFMPDGAFPRRFSTEASVVERLHVTGFPTLGVLGECGTFELCHLT